MTLWHCVLILYGCGHNLWLLLLIPYLFACLFPLFIHIAQCNNDEEIPAVDNALSGFEESQTIPEVNHITDYIIQKLL